MIILPCSPKIYSVSPKVGLLPVGSNPLPRYTPRGVYLTFRDTIIYIEGHKNNSMSLEYVQSLLENIFGHVDLYSLILPLLAYTLILAAYGIFIWSFYRSISKRDIFRLEIMDRKKEWQVKIAYAMKYLILFPVIIFLWFAAMTVILFFISKAQSTPTILLMSMAMVAAARITAYYKAELSQEIAKILPIAVLAIFVVDPAFFSLSLTISRFYEIPVLVSLLANYLLFAIVLEFVLRVLLAVKRHVRKAQQAH